MLSRAVCLLSVGLLAAQSAADPGATARKALDLMLGGKYQELNQMFTPDGQKIYSVDALTKLDSTIKSWGPAGNIGAPAVNRPGVNFVVTIPVSFARQNINFTIAVDPQGKLVVFLERPGEVSWQRPSYGKPESFHERAVTVGDGDWKLSGVLTVPVGNGPFPGVVLVHDSGPNDRDETVFGTKVFRDLAEGLASHGIVVLRYEKRSRQYAAKMATLPQNHCQRGNRGRRGEGPGAAADTTRSQSTENLPAWSRSRRLPGAADRRGRTASWRVSSSLDGNGAPLEDVMVDQATYLLAKRGATTG